MEVLADGAFESLISDGVKYAEVIISIWEWIEKGISLQNIVTTLSKSGSIFIPQPHFEYTSSDKLFLAAEKFSSKIQIRYLIDFVNPPDKAVPLSESIALLRGILSIPRSFVIGVNYSHCNPTLNSAELKELYAVAKENGLHTTIHAGEADSWYGILFSRLFSSLSISRSPFSSFFALSISFSSLIR